MKKYKCKDAKRDERDGIGVERRGKCGYRGRKVR